MAGLVVAYIRSTAVAQVLVLMLGVWSFGTWYVWRSMAPETGKVIVILALVGRSDNRCFLSAGLAEHAVQR